MSVISRLVEHKRLRILARCLAPVQERLSCLLHPLLCLTHATHKQQLRDTNAGMYALCVKDVHYLHDQEQVRCGLLIQRPPLKSFGKFFKPGGACNSRLDPLPDQGRRCRLLRCVQST